MNYRFIIEAITNDPDNAKTVLTEAIGLHIPLEHLQWNVSEQELSSHVKPGAVGKSPCGDAWRFYVEVETNSPDWTRDELERAIRNHTPAAHLSLEVEPGHIAMDTDSASNEASGWLRKQQNPLQ
jgi:hypothetical protein